MSDFIVPTFKDCVRKDIDKTFLNTDEFAEVIMFDGVEIKAAISNNDSREPQTKESDALGTYKWDRCLQVNKEDMPRKPEQGEYIRLNDSQLQYVAEVEEDMGMYIIYLVGNMR